MGQFFSKVKRRFLQSTSRKINFSLKQEALFIESLNEFGIPIKNIIIDHKTPKNRNNDIIYNLIFPIRYLYTIKKMTSKKTISYSFVGKYTSRRNWVNQFKNYDNSYIEWTEKGREIPKDTFDINYYSILSKSQYTLCPKGDFAWTYRFFEAIMCKSIPVIERGTELDYASGFKFLFADQIETHHFDNDTVNENYKLLLSNHTLIGELLI